METDTLYTVAADLRRRSTLAPFGAASAYRVVSSFDLLYPVWRDARIVATDPRPTARVLSENRLGIWKVDAHV